MNHLKTDLNISQVANAIGESVTQAYKYLKSGDLPPAMNNLASRNEKRYWEPKGIEEAAVLIKAIKKEEAPKGGRKQINQGACASGQNRPKPTYTNAMDLFNKVIKV